MSKGWCVLSSVWVRVVVEAGRVVVVDRVFVLLIVFLVVTVFLFEVVVGYIPKRVWQTHST